MKHRLFSKSDFKYTLRSLAKRPGFTLLSALVIAGGLGVTLLAFTVSNTMFHKAIPVKNGDSIYHICNGAESSGCRPFRAFEFARIREDITTLENIGIYRGSTLNVRYENVITDASATTTEWNMFQLTDTQAVVGRTLQVYDQEAGAEPVVVLGYDFWQAHFDNDNGIVGATITANGEALRVVGIMPEGYAFPWATDLWLPISPSVLNPIKNERVKVNTYSLLKDDVSKSEASAEIAELVGRFRQLSSTGSEEIALSCRSRSSLMCTTGHIATLPMGEFGIPAAIALSALIGTLTAFVFLLASINVGTLLLARTNERLKDVSIRVALGAPRKRLLLQMMTESILITLLGGVLAVLLAGAAMEALNLLFTSVAGELMAFWQKFYVDSSTILGAVLFGLLTVILTSGIPCWRVINGDFNAIMRDGSRGSVGQKAGRFSRALVVTAITCITLLVFIGIATGSVALTAQKHMQNLSGQNMIRARPDLDPERYTQAERQQFYRSLSDSLAENPDIGEVQISYALGELAIESEGVISRSRSDGESDLPIAELEGVTGPAAGSGTTLLQGRFVDGFENPEGIATVAVSQALAQQLWPGRSALGQRLRISGDLEGHANPWRQVVGVVSDISRGFPFPSQSKMVYAPLSQLEIKNATVRVSPSGGGRLDADRASAALSQSILALAPELRFIRVNRMAQLTDGLSRAIDIGIDLAFGCVLFSFLVAFTGVFGLSQNAVHVATREIGTRRALGATDSMIKRRFLVRGCKQVLLGFAVAMLLASPPIWFFFDTFIDLALLPVTLGLGILYSAVILAIYQPVNKILRMEPSETLRYE